MIFFNNNNNFKMKQKKNYCPPKIRVVELDVKPCLLVGSNGELPGNPNYPI